MAALAKGLRQVFFHSSSKPWFYDIVSSGKSSVNELPE
jgi:hypothetical protein